MSDRKGPVLIELDDRAAPAPTPAEAPAIPDLPEAPDARAMQTLATLAARRPSRLARWFWALLLVLAGFFLSVAAWDFVTGLLTRNVYLGYLALGVLTLFLGVLLAIALREAAAFARLGRLDALHRAADGALAENDLGAARGVVERLAALYSGREELRWGRDRLAERQGDVFDADGLFALAEAELLAPLDAMARAEVEAAARQVATVTAMVPLALADGVVALTANLRMIRRIAEIYGGRGGTLGSWRLTR